MLTPAGKECPHYYEDFNRGRNIQECRLVQENPESSRWGPKDCAKCPIPNILQANASPDMRLKLTVRPALLGLVRQFRVDAWCTRHEIPIENPYVGCPVDAEENPALKIFRDALDKPDD